MWANLRARHGAVNLPKKMQMGAVQEILDAAAAELEELGRIGLEKVSCSHASTIK